MVFGAWLRWDGLFKGLTSDEMANVMPWSAWEILTDPEAGVNPPLFRLMFNVPFHETVTPYAGRAFSMVCSLASIGLAWLVGQRAGGGSRGAGLFAAVLFTVHPIAVEYGAIHRIYAWWTATALLHLWALGRALEAEEGARRPWVALAVGTAVLLPWIHYLAVPVLLAVGLGIAAGMPGYRRWWALYLPAAVAISPMVPAVLFQEARRVESMQPAAEVMHKVIGLGLTPPLALANPVFRVWQGLGLGTFRWHVAMTALVLGAFAWQLLRWRTAPATLRLVTAGGLGVMVAAYGLTFLQRVRDPTILMMLVFAAPVLAAVPTVVQARWARVFGWGLLAWTVGGQLPDRLDWYLNRSGGALAPDGARDFVASWRRWDEVRAGRVVRVHPGYYVPTMYFYQAGQHFSRAPQEAACGLYGPCYVWEGVVFAGLQDLGDGAGLDGLVVSVEARPEAGFGAACALVHDEPGMVVWDCGSRSAPAAE